MPKPLRYQQRLDRYPPILIRLLVVRGRGASKFVPDDATLATDCGLTMAQFKFVSYSTSWDDITDFLRTCYLRGCGIDLEKRRCFRRLEWMRRHGNFSHLKRSPVWATQFSEQLDIYANP